MKYLRKKPKKIVGYIKVPTVLILLIISITKAYGQTNDTTSTQTSKKSEDKFYAPFSKGWERQPVYPGGNEALKKFIESEMEYPQIAKENKIQGRVITNFVIERDGTLTNPVIIRGVDPLLDNEALRILKAMTVKWKPAEQTGKIVRVRFTLPIIFRLPTDETPAIDPKEIKQKYCLEKQPEFPGGTSALMKYLENNINYQKNQFKDSTEKEVITQFIVHKDGSISDINIVKGFDTSLNAEVVKAISNMPKWDPGIWKEEPVNARIDLPISFGQEEKEPLK